LILKNPIPKFIIFFGQDSAQNLGFDPWGLKNNTPNPQVFFANLGFANPKSWAEVWPKLAKIHQTPSFNSQVCRIVTGHFQKKTSIPKKNLGIGFSFWPKPAKKPAKNLGIGNPEK